MIEQPLEKHPEINKVGVNIAKLEMVTADALSAWYAEDLGKQNNNKKQYLDELFRVARAEENYHRGGSSKSVRSCIGR